MTIRASSLNCSDRTDRIRNLASVPFSFVKYWCDRKRILRNKYVFPFTENESSVIASYLVTFCLFNRYWKSNDDRTSLNCSLKNVCEFSFLEVFVRLSWSNTKIHAIWTFFFLTKKKNLPLWSIGYANLKQLLVTISVITRVCLSECYFTSLAWKWKKKKILFKAVNISKVRRMACSYI